MSSELPFDGRDLPFEGDDADAPDQSGDTAFRVANGVARVARAGAYVTGGALVASNGGGVPSHPGDQRLDSWHTGWSGNNDPEPDLPSPVVTFPDPEPYSVPIAPSRTTLAAHEGPAHGAAPLTVAAEAPRELSLGGESADTAAAYGTDFFPGAPSFLGVAPDSGAQGWSAAAPEAELPQWWSDAAPTPPPAPGLGFGLPEAGNFLTDPNSPLFGLPKHPAVVDKSRVGELTDTQDEDASPSAQLGYGHSTFAPWAQPQPMDGAHAADLFDGFDDFGVYVGVDAFASLYTELEVDFGVGPNGAYLTTEMKIEASAGLTIKTAAGSNIGDQLDNLSDWLDSKSTTTGGGKAGDQHGIGSGAFGSGSSTGGVPGAAGPLGSAAAAPAAASPFAAPPAPAPVAMSQAPVAPAVAPALAVPAAAAAPVVAATPLQTTIQPEAASSPIANVLAPPSGPSPLTAPAAAVPVLYEQQHPPVKPVPHVPVKPDPIDKTVDLPRTPATPVTKAPTTFDPGSAAPPTRHVVPDSDTVSTPGSAPTKIPGIDGKTPTDTDITVTKAPVTTRPTQPSTPDDHDVTTPRTGVDVPSTREVPTTHNLPTTRPPVDAPSVEVPTVSVPSQPTHTVPNHVPSQPNTVDVPSVEVPAPTYSVPNPAPVTPIKPPAGTKPISEQWDSSHGYHNHPIAVPVTLDTDHLATASAAGLSADLLPHGGLYDVHTAHGTLDHTLI
ncbi:hypothetical protein [Nocardia bovistercoris]|uniref:Uncharacterized protein n=1 Tax=Nocardia bovistercoris TaxID=2785916 RepID=A0A931N3I6_9NOCA|nr:hypothetical protein [Nocardia bovistercoris]MBH0777201.1 hypothetical protein [Nocardia bovistercoris]